MESKQNKPVTLEICMGTTCFVLGANAFETLEEQIETRWPGRVEIRASRCLDLCRGGKFNGAPYIRVNSVPVGKATPELVLNLIEDLLGPGTR